MSTLILDSRSDLAILRSMLDEASICPSSYTVETETDHSWGGGRQRTIYVTAVTTGAAEMLHLVGELLDAGMTLDLIQTVTEPVRPTLSHVEMMDAQDWLPEHDDEFVR